MPARQRQKIKGCSKGNRNRSSSQNAAYKAENRKRRNKLARLKKYCAKNPEDKQAAAAYESILEQYDWGKAV